MHSLMQADLSADSQSPQKGPAYFPSSLSSVTWICMVEKQKNTVAWQRSVAQVIIVIHQFYYEKSFDTWFVFFKGESKWWYSSSKH